MHKLHEKSPQSGTERFKKVFTRGLNRSVPFRSILRPTFQSRPLFGTERNVSSCSRVNTCKNFFVFWNSSISFRSVPLRSRVNGALDYKVGLCNPKRSPNSAFANGAAKWNYPQGVSKKLFDV